MKAEIDTDRGLIILNSRLADKEMIRALPGSSWKRDINSWSLPITWSSCLVLRDTFRERLEIGPLLWAWATEYHDTVITPGLECRNTLQREPDPTIPAHEDLFKHQVVDVEFLYTVRKCILANDVGTGKTASAIRGLQRIKDEGEEVFPALIVAPSSVKKSWEREFARWMPTARVEVVLGSIAKRRKTLLRKDVDVFIMNYEALRGHSKLAPYGSIALKRCPKHGGEDARVTAAKCEVHDKELQGIEFKSVVADEAHRVKSPAVKQSRAFLAAAGNAQNRFLLTGTPITSNLIDYYGLLHFMAPKEWPSKTKWIDRSLDILTNFWGGIVSANLKATREAEFRSATDYRQRRVMIDDVVSGLPDVLEERRDVEMSPKQKKAYRSMADNLIASLDGGDLLVADSPLIAGLRLLQLASSYGEIVPRDDPEGRDKFVLSAPSSKLDALMADLDDFEGRSTIIFTVSRQLALLLAERFDNHKSGTKPDPIPYGIIHGGIDELERDLAIQSFQNGETKFIIITIAAGGTGITLTAANTVVYLQRPWSLAEMIQSRGRARRIGSEIHDHITEIHYVSDAPLEETVYETLVRKSEDFEIIVRDTERFSQLLRNN